MRRTPALFLTAIFALMLYAPAAHAQWTALPNQTSWNQYLQNHPKTAAQIQANPSIIYNANWRREHPHFEQWANNHPGDWRMMREPAPWQAKYGAWYDKDDQWHDSDWYYHNKPKWAYEHHPEWWQEHKEWQAWKHEQAEDRREDAHERHEEAHNWKHHHHDDD